MTDAVPLFSSQLKLLLMQDALAYSVFTQCQGHGFSEARTLAIMAEVLLQDRKRLMRLVTERSMNSPTIVIHIPDTAEEMERSGGTITMDLTEDVAIKDVMVSFVSPEGSPTTVEDAARVFERITTHISADISAQDSDDDT